jgi:hypothetical protein
VLGAVVVKAPGRAELVERAIGAPVDVYIKDL